MIYTGFDLLSLCSFHSFFECSITEPDLYIPGHRTLCETFSHKSYPSFQKHPSSLPPESTNRPLLARRPAYTHFSLPLRPLPRLNHVANPARSLNISQCGLRPLVKEQESPECRDELSVKGIPCFSRAAPSKGPKQLHVFLPTESTVERDDEDSESIDEGFMDEVDYKASFKQAETKSPT